MPSNEFTEIKKYKETDKIVRDFFCFGKYKY